MVNVGVGENHGADVIRRYGPLGITPFGLGPPSMEQTAIQRHPSAIRFNHVKRTRDLFGRTVKQQLGHGP
jgi:hypothetical protein